MERNRKNDDPEKENTGESFCQFRFKYRGIPEDFSFRETLDSIRIYFNQNNNAKMNWNSK